MQQDEFAVLYRSMDRQVSARGRDLAGVFTKARQTIGQCHIMLHEGVGEKTPNCIRILISKNPIQCGMCDCRQSHDSSVLTMLGLNPCIISTLARSRRPRDRAREKSSSLRF
jgi:hypothetical protein